MSVKPAAIAMTSGLASVLCAASACAQPVAAAPPEAVSQAMLDALGEVTGVPGLSAAVWRDGTVVWSGTTGQRDVENALPVERDTRFRLASVSKLFAATAAAKLAEQDRLDLDAPVTTVLPWLANDWPPITARQLAAHASGLPHYQDVDIDRGLARYPTGRAAVAIFADRPLLANPGERYSYSSWGYTLLGALVEHVSGEPFTDHISRTIAPGVAADATDSADPASSKAYAFTDGTVKRAPAHDYSYTWGGGGLMASAEDVVQFGGAMLENRILAAATFDEMTRPYPLTSGEASGEDGYTVGFGWRSAADGDGHPITFHNGTTLGARSSLVLWREEGTASAILSNAAWTSSIDVTSQMLAAPFRSAHANVKPTACPTEAARFEGALADQPIAGTARFAVVNGICAGELELAGSFREYFSSGLQPVAATLKVVGIDGEGGLSRAGLVSPFGIYDLRAGARGIYRARLSSSRSLELRLLPQT